MNVVPIDELLELDVLAVITSGCDTVDEDLTEWAAANSVSGNGCSKSFTHNRPQKHAGASFLLLFPQQSCSEGSLKIHEHPGALYF